MSTNFAFSSNEVRIKFLKQILEESEDIESETHINFLQRCAVHDAIILIEESEYTTNQLEMAKRIIKGDISELSKLEI